MKSTGYVKCALGYWEIQEQDENIIALNFVGEGIPETAEENINNNNQVMIDAKKQLGEYFRGERKEFSLPIFYEGTAFQKKVWQALQKIPYGETKSYQEIAKALGNKNSVRAVGGANHNNPISIIVPCHRVIGKNGSLVGYGGGLDVKEYLLDLEEKFLYT